MARGEDPAISFFHVSRPLNLGEAASCHAFLLRARGKMKGVRVKIASNKMMVRG